MTDLTDTELDVMYGSTNDPRILILIAEVRRWRDHSTYCCCAKDCRGYIAAVGSLGGAHAPKEERSE